MSVDGPENDHSILLTGATGYVGGRLLSLLEDRGLRVRCLARTPAKLESRVGERTEVVAGDVLDRASLDGNPRTGRAGGHLTPLQHDTMFEAMDDRRTGVVSGLDPAPERERLRRFANGNRRSPTALNRALTTPRRAAA